MTDKVEITNLNGETWEHDGEWDREAAVEFSFMEAEAEAEAEAEERKLKWAREVIEKSHQKRSNENDQ